MTIQQLNDLLEYIKENNSWGMKMYEVTCERNRKAVKYVDFCFDTRDAHIFSIKLRCGGGEEGKSFRVDTQHDLDRVYAWLDEPLRKIK